MSALRVVFQTRAFETGLQPTGVRLEVARCSKHVVGGPARAVINAWGSEQALLALLERLREPVELHSNRGRVWWGYLWGVKVRVRADTVGRSLDGLYNKVQVAYTTPTASGGTVRGTTGWEDNDESVARYGTREKVASLSDAALALAEAYRDTLLAQEAEPGTMLDLADSGGPGAVLELRGWWDTLSWRHYQQGIGFEEHAAEPTINQKFGQEPVLGVGFLVIEGGVDEDDVFYIYHMTEDLAGFETDDRVVVFGASVGANNKTYTVAEGAKRDARSLTISTIGFRSYTDSSNVPLYLVLDFGGSTSHDLPEGEVLRVTGSTSNNGYRLLLKNERRLLRALAAATIGFRTRTGSENQPIYELIEFGGGLQDILQDEYIKISGSASNNGLRRVLSNAKRTARTLTDNSIGFWTYTDPSTKKASYVLYDLDAGLQDIVADEWLWVSGSASNNGLLRVTDNAKGTARLETASTIGFKRYGDEGLYYLYDIAGGLQVFAKEDIIKVVSAGVSANEGVYRVKDTPGTAARTHGPSTQIGFRSESDTNVIYHFGAGLADLLKDELIVVSGSVGNDGTYRVLENPARPVRSLTATTISFSDTGSADVVADSANGLGIFYAGDMVFISGASQPDNNGYRLVLSVEADGSELSINKDVDGEAAGASVTILTGNAVKVQEPIHDETPGASVTIKAGNHLILYEPVEDEAPGLGFAVAAGNHLTLETAITSEVSGASITVRAGNMLTVAESLVNETPGASVTVQAGNQLQVREAVTSEDPGASITLATGTHLVVEEAVTAEAPTIALLQPYSERIAQTFELASSDWLLDTVKIPLRKVGTPVDGLVLILCADAGGVPGTVLETSDVLVAATDIVDNMTEHIFQFDSTTTLTAGTLYWLVLQRSGTFSRTDYYEVGITTGDAATYPRGALYAQRTNIWTLYNTSDSPPADMCFVAAGAWETTRQIQEIAEETGQFLTAVDLEAESGIVSSPYRNGDRTGLAEIVPLLAAGTTNNRRLAAEVTADRRLRIYEEPASSSADAYRLPDGSLTTALGTPIPLEDCPVGLWVRLRSIISAGVGNTAIPSVFVEEAEYEPARGTLRLRLRGQRSVWEIFASDPSGQAQRLAPFVTRS